MCQQDFETIVSFTITKTSVMENYQPLKNFTYHLKNYFLQHPDKLPKEANLKKLQIRSFQNAWTDKRLERNYEYIRYMDILFSEENEPTATYLHSYIITYSGTGNIIDAMKMELQH